jgi:hypothetical protein
MKKLFKTMTVIFALIGVAFSGAAGYAIATHGELVSEFWSVKDELNHVPAERRTEVIAELPSRIAFEGAVRADMQDLPPERQAELYAQLATSRDRVFEQFKQRIRAEADIARKASATERAVGEVAEEIVKQLGRVEVGIELAPRKQTEPTPQPQPEPRQDPLKGLSAAESDLGAAVSVYGSTLNTADSAARLEAAVDVLRSLDRLGDEVQSARAHDLTATEKSRLMRAVDNGRKTLQNIKHTPGLSNHAEAVRLSQSAASKLTLER